MIERGFGRWWFLCALQTGLLLLAVAVSAAPALDDATLDRSAITPAVSGQWAVPARAPWSGEVFELELHWQLDWFRFNFIEGDLQWSAAALVTAPWSKPATVVPAPGSSTGYVSVTTQAMAPAPGALVLGPARQQFNLQPATIDGSGAPRPARSELIESAEGQLDVMALPPAPVQFSGAVGSYELKVDVSATEVAVGDTLAWTLILSGTGNWPMRPALPARRLPASFTLAEPPALRQFPGTSVFEGRLEETLLLTPTMEGNHELPAVQAVVFDPETGRYVTLKAPARSILVTPGIGWLQDGRLEPAVPRRQPIAGAGTSWEPPTDNLWHTLLMLPLVGLLMYWLALSLLHAWTADATRQLRRAQIQLRRLIRNIDASTDAAQLRGQLHFWQRLTAQRFDIAAAAPTPADLVADPEWAKLWREADTVLYGGATTLPLDWTRRAGLLLERTPLPARFNPVQALRRCHLMARSSTAVAVLCLMVILTATPAPGQDEQRTIPGDDWIASYNHSIRLLEEQRPKEAAAYAAAAWLRSPADAKAHALWLHTGQSAGFAVQSVLQPTRPLAVRLLGQSPALWRWVAVAAICILALVAGLSLAYRFGRTAPSRRALIIWALLGGCGALLSFGLLGQYGLAASPDSVVVWRESIARPLPIEQPNDGQALLLTAGTLARADKSVLGWWLLRLADGDSVWVRQTDLVWLWHNNPSSYPDHAKGLTRPSTGEF